jgi:hypothetical protein
VSTNDLTPDELIARLERELVRDPDLLEAERYAPVPAERGYWNRPHPFKLTEQDES